MLGEQAACAMVYGGAFAVNLIACVIAIPRFGMMGAAASVSMALIFESIALFWVARHRLGLHVCIWRGSNLQTLQRPA
jgi:O-antigen/teichoic acid export membrane protein